MQPQTRAPYSRIHKRKHFVQITRHAGNTAAHCGRVAAGLLLGNGVPDAVAQQRREADDLKGRVTCEQAADLWNAVRDEKRFERPLSRHELLPALVGENGMRDEARHGDGARLHHALGAVDEGAASLHKVVHEHDMRGLR